MKKSTWILAGNIALAAGAAGLLTYGNIKESRIHREHEREVQQMVDHFKSCPDAYREYGECQSRQERDRLAAEAETLRSSGAYYEAGMVYAQLGRQYERDAREMAGRCGESERRAIIGQIELRQEAGRRTP
jgi:hypothetical protein